MRILVVAPHPDDETLGCGGSLLKLIAAGAEAHWVIVSTMTDPPFSKDRMAERQDEIAQVARAYGFAGTHHLGFPTMRLDTIPLGDFVPAIAAVVRDVKPDTVFLPYGGDAHSDHTATFRAAAAAVKKFRAPSINRVLVYETLSETDNGLDPDAGGFRPTSFSDISATLDRKVEIMSLYRGEMVFPRSPETIRALATYRGGAANCKAAEAFMVLREFW